jgi:glutamyl-tRNA synthetase
MTSTVRTRFAPSPTGYMHIGNVRTALYAYLFAKQRGGTFILRLEDTDQERYVPEAVQIIYDTLKLVGLSYQEGPDVGGDYGPYVQSERKAIYQEHIDKLIELGGAYRCFCTHERLDELRSYQEAAKLPTRYDGLCKKLTQEEIEVKLAAGTPFVVRQRIEPGRDVSYVDHVFGQITVNTDTLDEGVLMKTTGLPTYNFANVIDDHLMRISHIIRGSEYLSSTPKYILMYEAFGWEIPQHVHLPPIMKTATKKISKRDGDASFYDLLAKGYIKEAVVNMIALLGWHPSDDRELYSLKDLEECFTLEGLQKAPAVLDMVKMQWFNKQYLQKMSIEEFEEAAKPFLAGTTLPASIDMRKVMQLLKDRVTLLSEVSGSVDFFGKLPEYDAALFEHKKSKSSRETAVAAIKWAIENLPSATSLAKETLMELMEQGKTATGLSTSQLLWAIRVAVSGQEFTPGGAYEILDILGKEEALRRLRLALEKLA